MMVTYNVGTGIVIARKDDGSWSAPSAISTFGMGWGAQVNGLRFLSLNLHGQRVDF